MAAVRRLEAVCRQPAGCSGAVRAWRLAALAAAGVALALAGGDAAAQCARCSQPIFGASGPGAGVPRKAGGERSWRKEARRETRPQRMLLASGASTVCVRTCDGAFFPVTYIGAASRANFPRRCLPVALPERRGRPLFVSIRRHD